MKFINGSLALLTAATFCPRAEEVAMKAENAVIITFPSQSQRSYKLLAATNANSSWATLQDGIVGTGGEVTIFYKSQRDQKFFFKIETSDGPAGQRSLLSLARLDLSNSDLTNYDLEGQDLRGFKFFGAKFDNANLTAANLSEAGFDNASFVGADLSHATVDRANFFNANLTGANLEGIVFDDIGLTRADLRNARLAGARFRRSTLNNANLSGLNLTNMNFQGSSLIEANLSGANLAGADLSRGSIKSANLTGADLSRANFEGTAMWGVNLAGRDLRGVMLRGVGFGPDTTGVGGDWTGVNAPGVNMSLSSAWGGSRLGGANFQGANLEGFNASYTDILAPFAGVLLTNANLRNANLSGADLYRADLRNADLTGANLAFANLAGANLTAAIGFDAEQPGIQYGPGPRPLPHLPPQPPGTVMPNGSFRNGTNPGTGLAPATLPARIVMTIEENGATNILDLAFASNGTFSHGVGGPAQGTATYTNRGRIAALGLGYTGTEPRNYWLLFTSDKAGDAYTGRPDHTGIYRVGTFTIP